MRYTIWGIMRFRLPIIVAACCIGVACSGEPATELATQQTGQPPTPTSVPVVEPTVTPLPEPTAAPEPTPGPQPATDTLIRDDWRDVYRDMTTIEERKTWDDERLDETVGEACGWYARQIPGLAALDKPDAQRAMRSHHAANGAQGIDTSGAHQAELFDLILANGCPVVYTDVITVIGTQTFADLF